MNFQKKHPGRSSHGYMCKGYKVVGNSRKWWGSDFHYQPTRSERKREAAQAVNA